MTRLRLCRTAVMLASALAAAAAGCLSAGHRPGARDVQPTLAAFEERVACSRAALPSIVAAADAVAARLAAHTNLLIDVPYWPQQSFAEELLNRSGGLALALPSVERPSETTAHDVVLFSMRAWESAQAGEIEKRLALLREYRRQGLLVVLFASRAGMPAGVEADHLIDNGAASGREDEAGVNAIANVLNGWLWTCEFTAAMTRRGKCPAILMSALAPGSDAHNAAIQSRAGRHTLLDCASPVPPGQLATSYLARVDRLLARLGSPEAQEPVRRGAALVADRLGSGRGVALASSCHILLAEIFAPSRTPWKPFNVVWQTKHGAFERHVRPGDLLVWFSFRGLSTPYEDYGAFIRATGADLVASYRRDDVNPGNNAPWALVTLEQTWEDGDAAVAIPCPPGRMAPVSGIEQGLLYRMLDDEAAARLGPK